MIEQFLTLGANSVILYTIGLLMFYLCIVVFGDNDE